MGISASCARDFVIRGRIFLRHRIDILNGVDDVEGMSIETLANTCLAKLTLYDKAVDAFGSKQALIYLKTLAFREFQKKILSKPSIGNSEESIGRSLDEKKQLNKSEQSKSDYDLFIKELDLSPNEKRLLRIMAKKGIPISVSQNLSDYQISLIEKRYREYRLKTRQEYYERRSERWVHYKLMDPDNPLQIENLCIPNDITYEKINAIGKDFIEKGFSSPGEPKQCFENRIFDITDIILRIRAGINQIQPARRTVAILLYKLYKEKDLKNKWKKPREGVEYKSFKDFAIEELGMREKYRDYLSVGKVLKEYHYFLDHLSDVDTEETFLKLRHLPDALKTHNGDEHLVIARLRSLSVREFKSFSIDPDFDLHYERKLTKKELDDFVHCCEILIRNQAGLFKDADKVDFIEAYHKDDLHIIKRITDEVVEETSIAIIPPAPMIDETADDGVHTSLDGSNQPFDTPAA
jgi:hypothetical protein